MKPLDLTQRPPRPFHEKLDGLLTLPRTVDKMRASLPGGNLGGYNVEGMSTRILSIVGIDPAELCAVVARSATEEEVGEWLHAHADLSKYDEANDVALHRSVDDIAPENRERFEKNYPRYREAASDTIIDIVAHDDAITFGAAGKP